MSCAKCNKMKFIDTIRILSLVLLICLGRKSFAQNESLRFEQVSIDEGLSNVFLTTIFQDSKGFIWFGTDDGLIKYDGYTFTKYRFDPFDPHSLSQNLIYTIWEDKLGSIWVGTYEGLCRFDRSTEKFTRYKPSSKAKFSDPNIFAINEDADGMMWIGSASGGLCRFDRQKGEFLPENFVVDLRPLAGNQGELHGQITCMYKDREGILWVGDRNGLHAINRGDIRPGQSPAVIITNYRNDPVNPTSLSGNIIGSIIEDKAGMIWVATDNGLNSFNKKTGIFKRYIHDPKDIHSITTNNLVSTESDWIGIMKEDRDGNLWIPSENGLVRFNKDRTIFSTYTHDPDNPYSLGTDIPNSVEIDKDGILWVASSNGIIQKANLNQKAFGLKRNDPKTAIH